MALTAPSYYSWSYSPNPTFEEMIYLHVPSYITQYPSRLQSEHTYVVLTQQPQLYLETPRNPYAPMPQKRDRSYITEEESSPENFAPKASPYPTQQLRSDGLRTDMYGNKYSIKSTATARQQRNANKRARMQSHVKVENTYRCGYCSKEKVSSSQSSDGHVRIRCECGGQFQDGKTRMHATWVLVKHPTPSEPVNDPEKLEQSQPPLHLATDGCCSEKVATPSISPSISRPHTRPKPQTPPKPEPDEESFVQFVNKLQCVHPTQEKHCRISKQSAFTRVVENREHIDLEKSRSNQTLSGHQGVTKVHALGKVKYRAEIWVMGAMAYIGMYDTPEEAAYAFACEQERLHEHEDVTNLNDTPTS